MAKKLVATSKSRYEHGELEKRISKNIRDEAESESERMRNPDDKLADSGSSRGRAPPPA